MRILLHGVIALTVVGVAACGSKSSTAATPCGLTKEDSAFVQPNRPVYRECAVDRKAKLTSTSVHPDFSASPGRGRGIQCHSVDLEFVVDPRGVPEPETARVVRTNDSDFADAWAKIVSQLRYDPGTIGGNPVRQIVDQHFAAATGTVVVKAGEPLPSGPPRDMAPPRC